MSPHRDRIDAFNARCKAKHETVEMVDGRVYSSDDNWQTIWLRKPTGWRPGHMSPARRITDKEEADLIRFIAVAQSSAGPA
jgi:hypothetical protein